MIFSVTLYYIDYIKQVVSNDNLGVKLMEKRKLIKVLDRRLSNLVKANGVIFIDNWDMLCTD